MVAAVRIGRRGRPSASWPRPASIRSTTARIGGAERKLRSTDRSRNSAPMRAPRARTRRGRRRSFARIGALEAEDGLLVVADGEDGSRRPDAPPRRKFQSERADDVPLALVGILRLVDEDVIGPLVELVADPLAHARLEQQLFRPADQVVEIDHAGGALRFAIGTREGLAGAQPGGERADHRGGRAHRQQARAAFDQSCGERLVIGRGLDQAGRRLARISRPGEHHRRELESVAARSASLRASQAAIASQPCRPWRCPRRGWRRRARARCRDRTDRRSTGRR